MNIIRSPAEAKSWLDAQGLSVAEFARINGLDRSTTYQVLSGVKKGRRGKAHKAAVALGIKVGIEL